MLHFSPTPTARERQMEAATHVLCILLGALGLYDLGRSYSATDATDATDSAAHSSGGESVASGTPDTVPADWDES